MKSTSLWNRSKPAARLRSRKLRLGEAEIDLGALKTAGEAEPDILAFAHQVALGDADIADHAFAGGVADAEGEFAGRLLLHLDGEDDPVGRAAGIGVDVHGLEEAKRRASRLRAASTSSRL